ncbi:hypothetical protein [Tropicimonas sp.]|uniref:hypothetical protein n=1 Tax=Tropicimonas sp. TaxID=2067044 RepID=UPI003A841C25
MNAKADFLQAERALRITCPLGPDMLLARGRPSGVPITDRLRACPATRRGIMRREQRCISAS